MVALFSDEWLAHFKDEWNREAELSGALAKIGFSSVIAYGFEGDSRPRAVVYVDNGLVTATSHVGPDRVNWDLRASAENWEELISNKLGAAGLSLAYATRRLRFKSGDYGAMVKDPRMARPFIKSFVVMGRAARLEERASGGI